jgi:hypothetical protein
MRRIFLICMLMAAACNLHAQGNATFHVFPQIADGIKAGTTLTGYVSSFLVTNTSNQPSNCTIQLYGDVANRLAGASSFTLQTSGSSTFITTALGANSLLPLNTGYATLSCSQPVAAAVLYAYVSLAGVLSGATVFSSPPATRAQLLAVPVPGTRLAVALANNTNASAQYQLALVTSAGQTIATATLTVPAQSNVSKFIDELMTVPPNFAGAFTVTSLGSAQFSLLGLIFSGDVFTSQPAAILAQ